MSINPLNDISQVYLEQVSFQEAKVDKMLPDYQRSAARNARYDNPDGALALGGGIQRARRAAHRERDELNKDAKDIRRGRLGGPQFQGETGKERIAAVKKAKGMKEALDPVGQEDADIDNDGDTDKTDKYLHNRRKAIGKAIAKKRGKDVKEGFSNWRQDLSEVMDDTEAGQKIKEKKVNNKIKINPKLGEAIEEIGGTLLEMFEIGDAILEMVEIEDIELIEKAESEQQQKLFGLALSVKRGQTPRSEASPEVLKIVDSMSEKKIRDFAKTKHEGIPKKVEEELQPTTPQQFAAQRQLSMAQKKLTAADQVALQKKKKDMQQAQEEFVSEEDYDTMKDRHLERGGMGARSSTSPAKSGSSKPETPEERKERMEKQRKTAQKALELVRQKYKGSLM
jgi:hypothetical protein